MTAQFIDGKAIGQKVRDEVAKRAKIFLERYDRQARLDVILVGEDPASKIYVRNKERASAKAGIHGNVHRLSKDSNQDELLAMIRTLNSDKEVDGILLQLPLPKTLLATPALLAIDPRKDVDGLHPYNAGLLALGEPGLRPCTPSGCMRLLEEYKVDPKGKRALVIGRSNLVGKPIAMMLLEKHATVTIAHSRTSNLDKLIQEADILVAAVGQPEFVKGSLVKQGATVLDVGINRLEDGSLVGDVEFESAAERAAFITPVPGGVGPMTIAMLLENTLLAAERRMQAR
ncbi:MAG: bifunctional methylenetetrahydrofolate dehydrogenase/methenyltetrahydrofolate cyclohydrolase FolD [Myxococcales bacterium]|nr:MAG: bifunctional methylenetetrahydrofolate dehydrogenase/methenyltetrahydrofolate cyclohydrolase FolD [Myxococcales bacterium]